MREETPARPVGQPAPEAKAYPAHRYWLLLAAYLTSSVGNWMYRLTLPLLVLHLTDSALATGGLYALEYLPYLLLAMFGGVIADRFDRRRVLIAGDLAAGVIACALALFVMAGAQPIWLIFVLTFLLACVDPLYQPAFQSILPALVPPERLATANARAHMGDWTLSAVGPMIGATVVTALGYQAAIFLDAATFLVSALLILLIGRMPAVKAAGRAAAVVGRSVFADIREGLRYLFRENRIVLSSALLSMAGNFAIWLALANLIFYLTEYHRFTPTEIGVVYGMQGVGAVLGAALVGRLLRRFPPGPLMIWAMAVGGLAVLCLIPARGPVAIGAAWLVQFAAAGVLGVSALTLRQRLIPERLLGRVLATARMLAFSSIPLASIVTGVLENALNDMYVVLAVSGMSWLLLSAAVSRSPLRRAVLDV
ncbi:MFS transporter [Sphaerimonospora thailandensis]|uniref:MFS transporter n=1 Tax=Sphaerimonospora thailandensis TaxID=795644 RepID=A0A8J3W020_9ACTN|nr:MFS transporter [Sphaerimonospora thailandensis]GIH70700.1 MFS transporter [Sphaerimonospora thailandensis]